MSLRELKMRFQILFESLSSIKKNTLDFLMRRVLSYEMRYCATVHEIRHLHARGGVLPYMGYIGLCPCEG